MGLAVAKALAARGGWNLHLLDLRPPLEAVAGATFWKVNVLEYDALANAFQNIFDHDGRLDFVFANAGIVERFNFYGEHPQGRPPPPPDQTVIDVNLKSVINTSWLAQHYFRQSTKSDDKNLIMTASVGALYRCMVSPSYCAAKHGVLGLMRSIAPKYLQQGVRVNAICPGTVKTNLLDAAAWATFSDDVFVPIKKISDTVLMIIDGYDVGGQSVEAVTSSDPSSNGVPVKLWGKAVELSGSNHFYREQPDYCDANMARCMKATERETYN